MLNDAPSSYKAFSATFTFETPNLILDHILISSTSTGTLKIVDGNGVTVLDTITPAANDDLPIYASVPGPITFTVANTLKATLFYRA